MALIPCKECGNQVSTEANTCPKCGARVPQPIGRLKILFLAMFGFVVFSFVSAFQREPAPAPKKTAEEIAATAAADEKFGKQQEAAAFAMIVIKKSLRDPDSFKVEFARVNDDSTVVCLEYRAKNGFGGVDVDQVAFVKGVPRQGAGTWNSRCAGQELRDVTFVAKELKGR